MERQWLATPRKIEVVRELSGEMSGESYYLIKLAEPWHDLLQHGVTSDYFVLSGRGGYLILTPLEWVKQVNVFLITDGRLISEMRDRYDSLAGYTWGQVYPSLEEARKSGYPLTDVSK